MNETSDEGTGLSDEERRRLLLLAMKSDFPDPISDVPEEADTPHLFGDLLYLEHHGLCESGLSRNDDGSYASVRRPVITVAGLDYLAEGGGLTAALGVVTVRFTPDTLHDLIEARLNALTIPESQKSLVRSHLAGLSEAALKSATGELMKLGVDHVPDIVEWIRRLAGF